MKRRLLIAAILVGAAPCVTSGQSSRLANAGKAGLYVSSLEQVLRLRDEQMDLATAALIASEYWSDMVAGRRYLEQLDMMALEIRARLRQQRVRADYGAIPIINHYLFNELGFTTIERADDPNDLFLHSVMDRRRGYCLSLSVLYLSLAERLGLNLYGVVVPGHFFVRYDDGRTHVNIETTSGGANPTDEQYIEKFNVPRNGRDTIYMKNLTKRQVLGCFFNNLGNVYNDIGDIDTAQRALERATTINPTLSESRVNLGNIYLQKGLVDDAIQQYEAALGINPKDPKTYRNLGDAFVQIDLLDRGIASYRQAISLDPNFTDAHRNLALVYTRREQYSQALNALRQALNLEPQNAAIYDQFGEVYRCLKEPTKAIGFYLKALGLKRDSAETYFGLGLCYRQLGQLPSEIQAYRNALAIKPDLAAALVNLGNAYFEQKQYDQAIENYIRAIEVKPDDAWIYYNLGAAYASSSDFTQAVGAYQQAVTLDPGIADAHQGLAYGFYMLQRYDLAWRHINLAKQLGAKVPDDQIEAIRSRLN
ncbi:MAG: tetratricopeptide repeat protein [Sedimentisphaerales bacterium]|nr:tetratricopeptide repeat protein [Sedimentisphaerales bacterium]